MRPPYSAGRAVGRAPDAIVFSVSPGHESTYLRPRGRTVSAEALGAGDARPPVRRQYLVEGTSIRGAQIAERGPYTSSDRPAGER